MATIKDILDNFQGPPDEKQRLTFVLDVLGRLARATTDVFQTSLRALPTAPLGLNRIKADPYRIHTGTFVKVDTVSPEHITKTLQAALADTDPELRKTIGHVLGASLADFLGNTAPDEHRRDETVVTFDRENIIRVDVMLWRYVFDSHKLTAGITNVFAYGIGLSSVRTDETSDAILWLWVYQMVNKMTWLTEAEKDSKRKEIYGRLNKRKDPNERKRKQLAALTKEVNTQVTSPYGISVTADGTLYLASPRGGTVWRARPGTRVARVAGGGTGYTDGIPATEAKLDCPTDVAVNHTTGEYFIADIGDDTHGRRGRLLRVTVDGTIHTLADGATLPGGSKDSPVIPARLAVDDDGNLHVIAFQYDTPQHPLRLLRLAPDGHGSAIRQDDLQTPCSNYWRDLSFGVTARHKDQTLFSLTGCGTVNVLPTGSTELTIVAGGGERTDDGVPADQAKLFWPCGLDLDDVGNLYIADSSSSYSRVRKVTPGKQITTVFWGRALYAVAADSNHNVLYTVDISDNSDTRMLTASILPADPA
ncbi:hypothetical protein [Streptomyces sp. NPDC018045]|uniref:hypothetical protein n=1 Tax=Streptomyces sp. NPDC018045 TaxID=3365037 RepID=UPI0037887E75